MGGALGSRSALAWGDGALGLGWPWRWAQAGFVMVLQTQQELEGREGWPRVARAKELVEPRSGWVFKGG